MPTLCTFPSDRGQCHVIQDDLTAGPHLDVVVQYATGCVIDEVLRAHGAEDYAEVIVDLAREIARLQKLIKDAP